MSASVTAELLVEARDLRKSFGSTQALAGVDFALRRGEVHAVLGPNGAGKSTLVKVISGAYRADSGQLLAAGEQLAGTGPAAARQAGIETVHQDSALAPNLSVAENLLLGRHTGRAGLVNWKQLRTAGAAALRRLDLQVSLDAPVASLSVADRRAVDLARALARSCAVLILDEPTATLGIEETRRLIKLVRRLAGEGVGVIYVSHYLDEVLEVADRATVIRDGQVSSVRDLHGGDVSARDLARDVAGYEVAPAVMPARTEVGGEVLELTDLTVPGRLDRVSMTIRGGEVVGAFGAVGSGQAELAGIVAGAMRPPGGEVVLDGQRLNLRRPLDALRRGIGFVPADRLGSGLVPDFDILEMIGLTARALRGPVLARRDPANAETWIDRLGIEPRNPLARVGTLSGGNQQKVVVAKAVAAGTRVLVLEEPTSGVDVGAREDLCGVVADLAASGIAVLILSSDPEEVLDMCHRVLVLRKGRVVGELERDRVSTHQMVDLATGAEAVHGG